MSSHKGYGLALMVHILGGTLSGASFSPIRVKTQKPSDPDRLGHFFLAIDPKAFRPDGAFEEDLDAAAREAARDLRAQRGRVYPLSRAAIQSAVWSR